MSSRPATPAELYSELWLLAVTSYNSYKNTLNAMLHGFYALPPEDADRLRNELPVELFMHLTLRAQQELDDTP